MSDAAVLADLLRSAATATPMDLGLRERPIVLYGAGVLGRAILAKVRGAGLAPVAFADDTPGKQGSSVNGLPVIDPRRVPAAFGADALFVVTILNPALPYLEAKRRLEACCPGHTIVSFAHLLHAMPDGLLPFQHFDSARRLLASSDAITETLRLWADDESRRQYVAHLHFRLTADFSGLPPASPEGYFPTGIIPTLPADAVFVDCGAYDGDTLRAFIAHQQANFGRAFAFEPDPANYSRLRAFVASLPGSLAARLQLFEAALGAAPGAMAFNATGDMSAALGASGTKAVRVLRLDDCVPCQPAATYIKFDIEGAEAAALEGARGLICGVRPYLAISVYHRAADLWELPQQVAAFADGYRFFLRTCGGDGTDVVCFAVPGDR